jgi:hypothetical protein
MSEIFDLFGDPVPVNWGGRGRPAHIPTQEYRNKVKLLLAFGWNNERIARALAITLPTLRKHYFSELKFRDEQRDRMSASLAARLWKEVESGSVSAIKEFQKLVDRNDLMLYGQTKPPEGASEPKEQKLGKKEQALADALHPDMGSTLGDLMARRQSSLTN